MQKIHLKSKVTLFALAVILLLVLGTTYVIANKDVYTVKDNTALGAQSLCICGSCSCPPTRLVLNDLKGSPKTYYLSDEAVVIDDNGSATTGFFLSIGTKVKLKSVTKNTINSMVVVKSVETE